MVKIKPNNLYMTTEKIDTQRHLSIPPKLNGPKRQHFLPKFYLDGFTSKEGMLALYDRELDETRIQQPINTGVIGHFYTLEDSEKRKRFELEELLCEYESKASKIITKLAAKEDISADERIDMSIFIAFAAFRTPDMVDSLKLFNSDYIGKIAKRMFSDVQEVKANILKKRGLSVSDKELNKEANELISFANSESYEITTKHKWAISTAMEMAFEVAPILAGRDWIVTHRDSYKKSFVTTDSPVVLTTVIPRKNSFYGIGFANTDALVVFPLTESCVLLIFGNNGGLAHRFADTQHVRSINLTLADRCQRFVIGREETLILSLTNYLGLAAKKWQPKFQSC